MSGDVIVVVLLVGVSSLWYDWRHSESRVIIIGIEVLGLVLPLNKI